MPANKNAMIRYKFLDELLSDKHHYYDINDLTDEVNEKLENQGFDTVCKRSIEKDIEFLADTPFCAPIERRRIDGRVIIRYGRGRFSIFKNELSAADKLLLAEAMNSLSQFEGLEHFTWLEGLKQYLEVEDSDAVVNFTETPQCNAEVVGDLYDAISNRQVVELRYHTFKDETQRTIVVHPYLLKMYNGRWFLVCAADSDGFILTFAIDRIDEVRGCPEKKYKKCPIDLKKRYRDIVGVTLDTKAKAEDIVLWVSDKGLPYIQTKPVHHSQRDMSEEETAELRQKHPQLTGGGFVRLHCNVNTELQQQLMAYMDELVVLSPESLRETMKQRISQLHTNYFS